MTMPLRIAIACLVGMGLSYGWAILAPSTTAGLVLATFQVAMVSIVIWQACDPFADAASFLANDGEFQVAFEVRHSTRSPVRFQSCSQGCFLWYSLSEWDAMRTTM